MNKIMNRAILASTLAIMAMLGISLSAPAASASESTVSVAAVATDPIVSVQAGENHTCSLSQAGVVKCWGANNAYQMVNGDELKRAQKLPITITAIASPAKSLSVGGNTSCVVFESGTVKCWGPNYDAELGAGYLTNTVMGHPAATTPVSTLVSGAAKSIYAGGSSSCALMVVGTIQCWGYNLRHQVADAGVVHVETPTTKSLSAGVKSVSMGYETTCAALTTGKVQCWGSNTWNALGDREVTDSYTSIPVEVLNVSGATAVSSTYWDTCALLDTQKVKCWGGNYSGFLKSATKNVVSNAVTIAGLSKVTAISMGSHFGCALLESKRVECWGKNDSGQLGNGKSSYSTKPVYVKNLTKVASITTGSDFACALLTTGAVKCWGANDYGQLGVGNKKNYKVPVTVKY